MSELNAMIAEAMETAARLNAILDRIQQVVEPEPFVVRYFSNGQTFWKFPEIGAALTRNPQKPHWHESVFVSIGALKAYNKSAFEIDPRDGEP